MQPTWKARQGALSRVGSSLMYVCVCVCVCVRARDPDTQPHVGLAWLCRFRTVKEKLGRNHFSEAPAEASQVYPTSPRRQALRVLCIRKLCHVSPPRQHVAATCAFPQPPLTPASTRLSLYTRPWERTAWRLPGYRGYR